jgi:hypothetical protein
MIAKKKNLKKFTENFLNYFFAIFFFREIAERSVEFGELIKYAFYEKLLFVKGA